MSDLQSLRARIENNEVKGGSAFGRAVAEVIALTAEGAVKDGADAVRKMVRDAAEWGVRTKPSMTSVRVVGQIAVKALDQGREAGGDAVAVAVADAMRGFVARSERAIKALADSGAQVFRPGAVALIHSYSESLVNVLQRAARTIPRLEFRFTESRPLQESRLLMRALADSDVKMTLYSDAGMAIAAAGAQMAFVGADAIFADGSFANKTGTLSLALLCRHFGIPLYVAAELSKVHLGPAAEVAMEMRPAAELVGDWDLASTGRVGVVNQFFEPTPADFVTEYATEKGRFKPNEIAAAARADRPQGDE